MTFDHQPTYAGAQCAYVVCRLCDTCIQAPSGQYPQVIILIDFRFVNNSHTHTYVCTLTLLCTTSRTIIELTRQTRSKVDFEAVRSQFSLEMLKLCLVLLYTEEDWGRG